VGYRVEEALIFILLAGASKAEQAYHFLLNLIGAIPLLPKERCPKGGVVFLGGN
jgi:hypothetical protein